ncbi:MAG: hypothetical protein D4S01_07265 [Dehalococcoidia bacterium]|nr:MAG: hypothetical protein D4S01_07265 [Dehalococcoidia bacterium]
MTTILEEINKYEEPIKTANISDLKRVSVNMKAEYFKNINNKGEEYGYLFTEIEGIKYRIPSIVLGQLKKLIKNIPDLEFFYVDKTGEGKEGTKYLVIPLRG